MLLFLSVICIKWPQFTQQAMFQGMNMLALLLALLSVNEALQCL